MTGCVDATEQGRLQGSLASLTGLASLIGPTVFTETFAAAINPAATWHVPGAPFYLAAALLLMSMWLASRAMQPASSTAKETPA
jgi:DHA1 family tetracycline resistance protein-like MFS transporter